MFHRLALAAALCGAAFIAHAQPCPDKNLLYWQAFPPGGESDISARHQQMVLKKKCPAIGTVIQYKAGAGGALLWSQMNTLPGDGYNVGGVNLPPHGAAADGRQRLVQDRGRRAGVLVPLHRRAGGARGQPDQELRRLREGGRYDPSRLNLGGSGLNSANHAAHQRLNNSSVKTTYVPYKGTNMTLAVLGGHIDGAMSYTAFAINNKGKVRALAVAMDQQHPLMPDVPFKGSGSNWVDGAFRGVGVPKSTPPEQRKSSRTCSHRSMRTPR